MAGKKGWNQSLHGVKTRSMNGGVDDVIKGERDTFGSNNPVNEPSNYAARYKSQASKAGAKYRGGKSTDQAKGYGQADSLNKLGNNRF